VNDELSIHLAWCPPGQSQLGSLSSDAYGQTVEKPNCSISFNKGFWIAQTPITQEQWYAITRQKADVFQSEANLPAIMEWTAAKAFCQKLTLLLLEHNLIEDGQRIDIPSELHWEYACRAGTTTPWYFGNDISELNDYAWYRNNSNRTRHPVGQKKAHPWNIYDLYGNVAEWCINGLSEYPLINYETPNDPSDAFKVVRGGSYSSFPKDARSASRQIRSIDNFYNDPVGLRIVCLENSEIQEAIVTKKDD
jgi:formylglycine-generating enzyme required for sulfatase activity